MKLSSLMAPQLVFPKADCKSVDDAIAMAVQVIVDRNSQVLQKNIVTTAIKDRVALGGTILPGGIAIPHARLPGFNDIIIAAVIPKTPIPVPDLDPVKIIWVVLLGSGTAGLYIHILAAIAKIAGDAGFSEKLYRADTGLGFIEILEKSGIIVQKDLHISDLMTSPPKTILHDATVKDLLDKMFSQALHYLPVVDADGMLVGEISVLDVIDAAIPDYARRISNLRFMDELQPMEDFLTHEATMLVQELMKKPASVLELDDSVVDVALKMAKTHKRHFSVCDKGRLVGIVSAMDILSKVLRA